jgi:hypothetical protein
MKQKSEKDKFLNLAKSKAVQKGYKKMLKDNNATPETLPKILREKSNQEMQNEKIKQKKGCTLSKPAICQNCKHPLMSLWNEDGTFAEWVHKECSYDQYNGGYQDDCRVEGCKCEKPEARPLKITSDEYFERVDKP